MRPTQSRFLMASEVKLPPLGENVQGGDVIEVKVKVGDEVVVRQGLLEVEAEKSSAEVPSPVAGKISKVLVKKGDRVPPGQLLFLIEESNGAAKPAPAAPKPTPAKTEPAKAEAPKA